MDNVANLTKKWVGMNMGGLVVSLVARGRRRARLHQRLLVRPSVGVLEFLRLERLGLQPAVARRDVGRVRNVSSPAVARGVVYVASNDRNLYSVQGAWVRGGGLPAAVEGSARVAASGLVTAGAGRGRLHRLARQPPVRLSCQRLREGALQSLVDRGRAERRRFRPQLAHALAGHASGYFDRGKALCVRGRGLRSCDV